MSENKLLPDIPHEIRAARIGICYNSITRSLMTDKIAIDYEKIPETAFLFVNGKSSIEVKANSNTGLNSKEKFFGVSATVKSPWVSLGVNTAISSAKQTNSQLINCYGSYIYEGETISLYKLDDETLYKYMTDEFQKYYKNIVESTDAASYFTNYMNFINRFGHGFVKQLSLTSGSAFDITISYTSSASSKTSKYGAEVGVSTPWGGGGVACNFAESVKNIDANATMDVYGESIPENSPTKAWLENIIQQYQGQGISLLFSKGNDITNTLGTDPPAAPKLPDGKKEDKKEIPKGDPHEKLNITDDLKKDLMNLDGYYDWDKYREAQEEAYKKLTASDVVKNTKLVRSMKDIKKVEFEGNRNVNLANIYALESQSWDLGGYIPYDYEIEPWGEVFPDINKMTFPITLSSIYISKIFIYYLTRIQFSRYLYFLMDVDKEISKNDSIEFDAKAYRDLCDKFLITIENKINKKKNFTENDYNVLVASFESNFYGSDHERLKGFHSFNVYDTFFNNYDFLVENSYGFIFVDGKYYAKNAELAPTPKNFDLAPMLSDAGRFYIVIDYYGDMILARYITKDPVWNEDSRWHLTDGKIGERKVEKIDHNTYVYYELDDTSYRLYSVGFDNVPKDSRVRGLPMFDDLPFDEMQMFAQGEEDPFPEDVKSEGVVGEY